MSEVIKRKTLCVGMLIELDHVKRQDRVDPRVATD